MTERHTFPVQSDDKRFVFTLKGVLESLFDENEKRYPSFLAKPQSMRFFDCFAWYKKNSKNWGHRLSLSDPHFCILSRGCFNLEYSKHPHIRTHNFRGQTDCVLIYRMLSEKSASGCS